jgi:DNA-binding protein
MTLKNKLRLLRLALLAISTVVSLILLEFTVRARFPWYNPRGIDQIVFHFNKDGVPLGPENQTIRQRSPQGDYDLKVSFNRFGFRDTKDLTTATPTDWFVVGDSFALGWGVEETNRFSNLLEKKAPFRVFNICNPTDIAGYGQLLDYAKQCGATISNLVIGICMENDLRDYYRANPSAAPPSKRPIKEAVRDFAKSHSAVYLLIATELQQFEPLRRFFQAVGIARKRESEYQMHYNSFDEPAIHYSVDLLDKLTSGRTRVVVLIIPSRGLWIGKYRDVEAKVHDLFVSEVRKKNIEVIDMRPVFESTGDPMQFHFTHDGHWSEKGHRLAAQYLAELILSGKNHETPIQDHATLSR